MSLNKVINSQNGKNAKKLVLLIGRAAEKSGRPGRGWRLADRPGRIFMQKIVIPLISGLIIYFADFFDNFRFFTGILNTFLIN
jgi:hypothetical protein